MTAQRSTTSIQGEAAYLVEVARQAGVEMEKLQSRFPDDAGHSFRTPLTVIDSAAHRLERRADNISPQDVMAKAEMIRSTVQDLLVLVERTIELAALSACPPNRATSDFGLVRVLERIAAEQRALNPDIELDVSLDDCPDTLVGDPKLMEFILDKLITIGADLVETGGRLDIAAWSDDDDVTVSLKSTFYASTVINVSAIATRLQAEMDATEGLMQTGVSLKLIKLILEMHGGELDMDYDTDFIEIELRFPKKMEGLLATSADVNPNAVPSSSKYQGVNA